MTEEKSSSEALKNGGQEPLAADKSEANGRSRLPLQDLYISKRRELAKAYFDTDIRLRLLQEMESSY